MQRQAKRVMVPCVNTTALQCWPHWHPTMLSIPHCLHNTTTLPLPCASPPLRELLLPYARYLSFQPHEGECRHAESGPLHPHSSPSGVSHCDNKALKDYSLICILHGREKPAA